MGQRLLGISWGLVRSHVMAVPMWTRAYWGVHDMGAIAAPGAGGPHRDHVVCYGKLNFMHVSLQTRSERRTV